MTAVYDVIGTGYVATRRADPRIASAINAACHGENGVIQYSAAPSAVELTMPPTSPSHVLDGETFGAYNNGPAGVAGVGTRPPLKELYAIWPCLVPREHVPTRFAFLERP